MAEITPYKIATRNWSLETMGESIGSTGRSLVRTSSLPGDDIIECISLDDLNQTTSTNYVIPSSKNDGAVPSAIISGGNKCVTQAYLDSLYSNKIININTNINRKTSTGSNLVATPYSISITAEYDNMVLGDFGPRFSNIYTDLKVTVNFSYNKPASGTSLAISNYASETYTLTANPTVDGKIKFDLLLGFAGSNLNPGTTQGQMSVTNFLNQHLSSMYSQYSSGLTSSNYSIDVSITPEYSFLPNSPYTPHKHICYHNITTTTSSSSSMTPLTCDCVYSCTSNPIGIYESLIPGQTYTWGFKITMSNFSPTQTSSPASYVTLSKGSGTDNMDISVSKSWNSSTKKLTLTGTATCIPTITTAPSIKLTYSKTGDYTPFVQTFALDWNADVESDRS